MWTAERRGSIEVQRHHPVFPGSPYRININRASIQSGISDMEQFRAFFIIEESYFFWELTA